MAINSISPTTFTSGVLITDTSNSAGGARGVINGTITPSTAFDIQSTSGAFCPPRMTTTQRDALVASNGMFIYNTTTNQMNIYQNGAWAAIESGADINVVGQTRIIDDGLAGENVFLGRSAGIVDLGTANNNVGVGSGVLNSLASGAISQGANNVAVGADALTGLTTGSNNIGIGTDVLSLCATGSNNIGIGSAALLACTSTENIAIGNSALEDLTTGAANIAIGSEALSSMVGNFSNNIAVGPFAGQTQTQYSDCTFVGSGADASVNNLTNAIAIGALASVGASNSMVLGAAGTKVGIGTTTPGAALSVIGGQIGNVTPTTGTPYVVLATDYVVLNDHSATAAVAITLPAATVGTVGQMFIIKDTGNNAGTNNITITPAAGTIDGAASVLINTNNGFRRVINDGTNWWTI